MTKPIIKPAALALTTLVSTMTFLAACEPASIPHEKTSIQSEGWPSISAALTCLSNTGPIIAAHRGRDKSKKQAENSLGALKAIRNSGYIIAEIDIAQLKDRTLIAFHDGVWDRLSTGKGPISSSTWPQAQKLLLKTRRGKLTSERPAKFEDILNWANQEFYLEIDFKSSTNERDVIAAITQSGMQNHVILISYNDAQARRLRQISQSLTDDPVLISINAKSRLIKTFKPSIGWLGDEYLDKRLITQLKGSNIPVSYGLFSPKYAAKAPYEQANILVSDYLDEAKALSGNKDKDRDRLKLCP